jgi:hypothetical protein
MTIDRFDAAVIERHFRNELTAPTVAADADRIPCEQETAACPGEGAPSRPPDAREKRAAIGGPMRSGVVRRLLDAVPEEWERAAAAILEQQAVGLTGLGPAGFRVAFLGMGRGVGCSTVVDGIAATLAARGIGVVVETLDRSAAPVAGAGAADAPIAPEGPCAPERNDILLLDASGWFGPGPIRRGMTARLRDLCDAAILVRRASAESPVAHARALESAGVCVLGEVLAFAASGTCETEEKEERERSDEAPASRQKGIP